MFLLTPNKYNLAASELKEVTINNLFARAVVERHVDGKIYVDNLFSPNAFYVLHPCGMSLLYGAISDDFLKTYLKNYLLGRNGSRNTDESLQIFPTELEKRIDAVLGTNMSINDLVVAKDHSGYGVIKYKRINFKFNRYKFEQFLPTIDFDKYRFLEVDSSRYNEIKGSVVPSKFWNNASDFALYGLGFSLIYENQSVAVAFSSFVHEQLFELGIETKAEYRKRGFASIVSAKLITYCLANDLEPVWSCRLGNHGSYNLALKLGFEPIAYLPYYDLLMQ